MARGGQVAAAAADAAGGGVGGMEGGGEVAHLRRRMALMQHERRRMQRSLYAANLRLAWAHQGGGTSFGAPRQHFDVDAALAWPTSGGPASREAAALMGSSMLPEAMHGASQAWTPQDAAGSHDSLADRSFVEEATFTGHSGAVYVANFSPCGRLVASVSACWCSHVPGFPRVLCSAAPGCRAVRVILSSLPLASYFFLFHS